MYSIEAQIKFKITSRIFMCFFISFVAIIVVSFYDISSVKENLNSDMRMISRNLQDIIVSQTLIGNKSVIEMKIKEYENENNLKINYVKDQNNGKGVGIIFFVSPINWMYRYNISSVNGVKFGQIIISGSLINNHEILYKIIYQTVFFVLYSTALLLLLLPLAKKIPQKLFVNPTNRIIELFSESKNVENVVSEELPKELEELEIKIKKLLEKEKEHERNEAKIAIGSIAERVAHDIESPLAALNNIIKEAVNIPEDVRIMIRDSTQLISDIANNLLSNYQKNSNIDIIKKIKSEEIISLLLGAVVSQKRAQHRNTSVEIKLNVEPDSHGVFASINSVDFKRVISNLIDNSVQAIITNGIVNINLRTATKYIEIDVSDNGSGIHEEVLNKIMNGERITSKKTGHGIGLEAAFEKVHAWSGEINISTTLNQGTTIHIRLPMIEPAYWFLSKLKVSQNSIVVILDDDKSIHGVWGSRIKSELPNAKITLISFYTPNEILNYNFALLESQPVQYLCDYELLGSELNGLDIIEKLKIESSSVLVTSRYENEKIRGRCSKLGVKVLPKSYTIHIPLELVTKNIVYSDAEIVFIDDNKVLTQSWKIKADNIGKKLDTFNTVSEFIDSMEKYSKETIFYIDAELDNGQSGINVAKILYGNGYRNLYLATGHKRDYFGDLPFLKDIIGKNTPF